MSDRNEIDTSQPSGELVEVETFGYHIEPELMAEFRRLMTDVRQMRDPSRNWFGLELVRQLSAGELPLSPAQKEKILLISCDDNSDGVGEFSGIETLSLSPQSLRADSFEDASLAAPDNDIAIQGPPSDPLLQAIYNEEDVFQLTADTLRMLQQKEAIVFVSESHDGSYMHKFVAFLGNKFMQHLIDKKYLFFALGIWKPGDSTVWYDSYSTGPCSKDANPPVGQDFWSPS